MKFPSLSIVVTTATAGLLSSSSTCEAWVVPPSSPSTSSSSLFMGSRSADKWEKKKVWLESRGVDLETGVAVATADEGGVEDGFCAVVGGGRIGSMLVGDDDETKSLLIKRGDTIPEDGEGTPILLATRNDALEGIIDACPENRRKDLVFMQNGYLDDFLASKGLQDNTQVLLFVAVAALGEAPTDGITAVNPEGLTTATGVHADAFKARLSSRGMKCNLVTPEDYRPAMFEKLMWISVYMLVGTAKECSSVGQAGSEHGELVEQLVNELVAAVSEKEGITFQPGTMERLAAYTDVVAHFPCGVKEFEWRNQYFYNLGDEACPTHNGLLRECAEKGLLSFELP